MAHEHGPHTCYCPSCHAELVAEAYQQCNTISCPQCGSRMRAKETGEYREARLGRGIRTNVSADVSTDSLSCPVCNYPIPAPSAVGEQVKCAYCGTVSQAIKDITVPTTVVVGFVTFTLGAILGPAVWNAVKGAATALERVSRERIG